MHSSALLNDDILLRTWVMHVNVNLLLALNLFRLLELFLLFAFPSLACVTFDGFARGRGENKLTTRKGQKNRWMLNNYAGSKESTTKQGQMRNMFSVPGAKCIIMISLRPFPFYPYIAPPPPPSPPTTQLRTFLAHFLHLFCTACVWFFRLLLIFFCLLLVFLVFFCENAETPYFKTATWVFRKAGSYIPLNWPKATRSATRSAVR